MAERLGTELFESTAKLLLEGREVHSYMTDTTALKYRWHGWQTVEGKHRLFGALINEDLSVVRRALNFVIRKEPVRKYGFFEIATLSSIYPDGSEQPYNTFERILFAGGKYMKTTNTVHDAITMSEAVGLYRGVESLGDVKFTVVDPEISQRIGRLIASAIPNGGFITAN